MGLLDTLKELLGMRDTLDASKDDKLDSKDATPGFEQFEDTNKDGSVDMVDIAGLEDTPDVDKDGRLSTDDVGAILHEKLDRK